MAGRIALGVNGSLAAAPGDTPVLRAVIVDEDGDPIAAADLATLTLAIVDQSGQVIVGNPPVDILNTGRGAVDANGNLTVSLLASDTALAAGATKTVRSLVLAWSYNEGASAGHAEVDFEIKALAA